MQLAIHQAVIKCMLNSPTADAAGYCNLFSLGELKQLCRREDKLMSKVKDVQDAIEIMEGFFKAYGKFSDIQLLKLISLFEVRCIMFMFNKRSPSRTAYASIKEIMVSVDVMARLYYDKLPVMPMLAAADSDVIWSVCAFGATEASCMLVAAGLGGHARVGFENNMQLLNGDIAPNNGSLITQVASGVASMGRHVASCSEARSLLGMQ